MSLWQAVYVRVQIMLWRYGWQWALLIALLLATALVIGVLIPRQSSTMHQISEQRVIAGQALELQRRAPPPLANEQLEQQRLEQFHQVAYAPTQISTAVQVINQIAAAKGLVIAQSEFQTTNDGFAGLRQVQVSVPIRGSYPKVREFVEVLLRQLQGVSLDQITIKRDQVQQNQADVRLKLSIWVHPLKTVEQEADAKLALPAKGTEKPVVRAAASTAKPARTTP